MEPNDFSDFLEQLSETGAVSKFLKYIFKHRTNRDKSKLYFERTEKYAKLTEYSGGQISRTIESKESKEKTNSPNKQPS